MRGAEKETGTLSLKKKISLLWQIPPLAPPFFLPNPQQNKSNEIGACAGACAGANTSTGAQKAGRFTSWCSQPRSMWVSAPAWQAKTVRRGMKSSHAVVSVAEGGSSMAASLP